MRTSPLLRGSSPRMRGAQSLLYHPVTVMRIIPADAGSTTILSAMNSFPKDHPRGCGEHIPPESLMCMEKGSSPRMRGAQKPAHDMQGNMRIIPADAGSTSCSRSVVLFLRDHPRGCGEHSSPSRMPLTVRGSSPRMRGAHPATQRPRHQRGIIPADAGSTWTATPSFD